MPDDWVVYACLFLGLSSALVGGVFKAFSEFVMKGLILTDATGAIQAMQHINRAVMHTEFIVSLIAMTPLSIAFALYSLFYLSGLELYLVVSAALVYCSSVFLVTIAGNVPMNKQLAKLPFASSEARDYWTIYGKQWTRLNHIRTIGSIVTAGFYLLAMLKLAQ